MNGYAEDGKQRMRSGRGGSMLPTQTAQRASAQHLIHKNFHLLLEPLEPRQGKAVPSAKQTGLRVRSDSLCLRPQLKGRVSHFVDEALQARQGPTCTPGPQWVNMEKALAGLAGLVARTYWIHLLFGRGYVSYVPHWG